MTSERGLQSRSNGEELEGKDVTRQMSRDSRKQGVNNGTPPFTAGTSAQSYWGRSWSWSWLRDIFHPPKNFIWKSAAWIRVGVSHLRDLKSCYSRASNIQRHHKVFQGMKRNSTRSTCGASPVGRASQMPRLIIKAAPGWL